MLNHIKKSEFLNNIYPEGLILKNVIVSSLIFNYNGPSVEISLISRQIPSIIPPKWDRAFNRIKLVFDIFDVIEVSLTKWGRINNCNIEILEILGSKKNIKISGDDCRIELITSGIYFKSITPFTAED